MRSTALNQAAFSRHVGIDRSTLSQLLSPTNDRLPRAETLVAIAAGCRVSVDWLLGLSQREQVGAEMVEAPLSFEPQTLAPLNDRFLGWMAEAGGLKIRTVPLTFPDFLKTPDVLKHEYASSAPFDTASLATFEERRERFASTVREGLEVEACFSVQAIETFALGQAQWTGLSDDVRRQQLRTMEREVEALYPTLRLFLYDLRETFSAPFSVFGQGRAAVFLGPGYLVLNAREHIRLLTRRFDDLIRLARIQPHQVSGYLRGLG